MTKSTTAIDLSSSKTCQQLRGKQVLITGTTGFVGKVIIEKLMRMVPDIGGIHLLIRGSEKHPVAADRFTHDIASSSVFERIKRETPDTFDQFCEHKIHCISGEVTEPLFGLPRAQFEALAGQLDLVINSAASVNFREALDKALEINTLCLRNLVELSKLAGDIPVVQVSTCYVSGLNKGHQLEEVARPAHGGIERHQDGYYEIEPLVNLLLDKVADVKSRYQGEQLQDKLIELGIRESNHYGWNDTYTFTKWMGEQLLIKALRGGTLTIVRPSIVESALSEPMPGWIEGVKVADAIILAYAREKVLMFPGKRSGVIDVIPVDLVANAILLSAGEALAEPGRQRIYQACSGSANPVTIGELVDHVMDEAEANHAKYDRLFYRKPARRLAVLDRRIFTALISGVRLPLKLLNSALRGIGQEKDLRMLTNLDETIKLSTVFAFYTSPNYIYHSDALLALSERSGATDQALFPVDAKLIDWKHYFSEIHLNGLNTYALNERKLYRLKPAGGRRKVA